MKRSISGANSASKMVVVGSSAGGIEALHFLLSTLPASFLGTVAVVQHIKASPTSNLGSHFAASCALPCLEIEDKQPIRPGTIFFAPADYHVLVDEDSLFHLSVEEPVNFARPSIDILFETAARIYKSDLTAIVLTGANNDGAAGSRIVQQNGGRVLVQDPKEALHPIMPEAALEACPSAEKASLEGISKILEAMA